MNVHLVNLQSDIVEDDYNEGEGKSTGCGYQNEKIGKTFDSFLDMLKYLAATYGLSDQEQDYNKENGTLETSKTVADHSQAQNGGWFEATAEELTAWRDGAIKLFSENYTINYHYIRP